MKKHTHFLELSVDNPCQEAWSEMRPEKTGRHCFQCDKTVRDFTWATDFELADFFRSKPTNVCGRFRPDQLQRPLPFRPLSEQRRPAPWRSAALIGGLLLGGGMAAAQSASSGLPAPAIPPPPPDITNTAYMTLGEVWVETERSVKGQVLDDEGEPLIAVSILLVGTRLGTVTDFDGTFEMAIPDTLDHFALDFSYVGYEGQTVPLSRKYFRKERYLKVQLKSATYTLEEIAVIGYSVQARAFVTGGVVPAIGTQELCKPKPFLEKEIDNTLVTFPNPFRETMNIRFQTPCAGNYQLRLMDQSGRLLQQYSTHFDQGEQQLEAAFHLDDLPAGTYLFQLVAPDGTAWVKQIVKN